MLPSMPSLQTPVKNCIENESKEDLKIAAIDIVNSNVDNKSDIVLKSDLSNLDKIDNMEYAVNKDNNFANTNKDNLADINALMVASSTVKPVIKKEQTSGAEKKRAKMQKEFMANLAIAKPEDPIEEQKKNERFALAYYDKLRETLELDDYHKIMQIFNDCQSGDAVDLYKKVDQILRPKYEELAEEFLLFLREKEAFAVGRLLPWIQINARSKFLTKVEIYFKDQPAQLKKIYRCLTELSQSDNISMEKIKTTLLPMLKGNKILLDLFFQNCLDERPPSSLLDGPYEIIDFNKEMGRTVDDELFETVTISETKDNYGSFTCICSCHKIEDPEFKSRSRHCIPCGTRFIQGKVYIQTGRGPKPATVSFFPGKCKDSRLMSKSISNVHKKKRSGSPSKHVMHISPPAKENPDDDSDEEIDSRNKSRNKSKKYKKKLDNGFDKANQHNYTVSVSSRSSVYKSNRVTLKDDKKRKRTCSMKDKKVHMLTKVENMELGGETEEVNEQMSGRKCHQNIPECDLNGSGESTEKPTSSGAQTADSESEFCEESSQDNCESDSYSTESTVSNMNSQSDSNVEEWKKEEDRIILETFQRENDKEHAFKLISKKLVNRTIREIRNRFSTLMTLLLEQIGRN